MSELTLKNQEILNKIKRRLPHSTQGIVEALGWEGALTFLRTYGKRTIYVPKYYDAQSRLFIGLTEEQATKLIAQFGGKEVQIPGYARMLASERHQHIAFDFEERKFTEIMLRQKYGLSRHTIKWIIDKFNLEQ